MAAITRRGFLAILGAAALAGCSQDGGSKPAGEKPEPLNLTGTWRAEGETEDSWQEAVIADGTITVDWVSDGGDTRSVYWVGTYEAPTEDVESYKWESAGDTEAMATALLASTAESKEFSYEDGKLVWEVSMLGTTKTVRGERQE